MPIGSQKIREINGKESFARWVELGSCNRVSAEMARNGKKNRKGLPYHPASVYTAILRYVTEHPDEARPVYIAQDVEFAKIDADWWFYVVRKSWTRLKATPGVFLDWLDKWELSLDNYAEIIGDYMPYLKKIRVELAERRKLGK